MPPTSFAEYEFLSFFQMLVNTYGVPTYQELNPAIFYVVSFPFFFGIMFGDIYHGSILLAGAVCLFYYQVSPELNSGKYCFLLMGVYATYCGLIYNDFASIPTAMFTSCYDKDDIVAKL